MAKLQHCDDESRERTEYHSHRGHGPDGLELSRTIHKWPDAGYDIEELSDPFDSGVLLIRVRMAVIAASTTSFEDDVACAYFDEDEPEEVDVNCILICIIGTAGEDRQPGEVVKHTHLAMAVERHTNGVYYRKGLVGLQTRHWEAAEIGEQTIRLG
jgi:hypothetical protein